MVIIVKFEFILQKSLFWCPKGRAVNIYTRWAQIISYSEGTSYEVVAVNSECLAAICDQCGSDPAASIYTKWPLGLR